MKKILPTLYLLLFSFVILMSGCSGAGSISTYTISLPEIPKNLDAQVATAPQEILVLTNIFDGLYDFIDGEAVPNLAQDCKISDDGLEYTFTIKNTSNFNGEKSKLIPVTARDFAFSFKRILDPTTRSPYYNEFKNIQNIQVVDDYTLKITLAKPDQNFLDKLCLPAATPCNEEFFLSTEGAYGLGVKKVLSNGPFKINYLADDGSYATVVGTTDKKNVIDRIRLVRFNEGEDVQEYFKEDKISGFFEMAKSNTTIDGTQKNFSSSSMDLVFNLEKPEFQNENIRKALGYYAFALENSGANLAALEQSFSIFSDTLTFSGKSINEQISLQKPAYLSENAKQLCQQGLSEIGQPKLSGISVLIPSDNMYSIIFENINQLWQKELGQFFTLEFLPTEEISKRVSTGDFGMAFIGVTPQINSPFAALERFEEYDTDLRNAIQSAHSHVGNSSMLADIEKAHNIAIEKAYTVPMCKNKSSYWHKKYFENVKINPFGNIINLKYATAK